ncbi:MAG TPA: DEAD/DEAH box helicase [Candidatus Saccharimonadales bacterium]|nr:DEAD/DEAH box helicase [Candidatus Saccharimonadales bacterium]
MSKSSFAKPVSQRGNKVFRNSRHGGNNRPQRAGQYIDPQRFINQAAQPADQAEFVPTHTFNDFGLMPELERTIAERGFSIPTPIQDGAIKPALAGRDIIGIANTGTGKTAAFVLPIIQALKHQPNQTALIIAPTRELAIQIDEEFRAFARGLRLYSALIVGGAGINRQVSQLRQGPQVVVGTPGRLKDLYNQHALKLGSVGILVLDEADRMLDMGFIHDIRFLLDRLPAKRQSYCFSATIPADIRRLIDQMLVDPVVISVRTSETSDHVEQNIIRAGSKDEKIRILQGLLAQPDFDKVLIFGQTKWSVQRLADNLAGQGFKAEAIHGNKSQPQRQRALQAFKDGRTSILVATDVAARGLDIPQVSHVINFDQPTTYEDYIHRIGRTGRAGHRGHALTFVAGPAS